MTAIGDLQGRKALRCGKLQSLDPLVGDIVDALHGLSSAAHRKTVADCIAARRHGRSIATRALQREVFQAFDAYLANAARRSLPLLHRPFGETSYRWALTAAGEALIRGRAQVGQVGSR